jgi:hypothetical protein
MFKEMDGKEINERKYVQMILHVDRCWQQSRLSTRRMAGAKSGVVGGSEDLQGRRISLWTAWC